MSENQQPTTEKNDDQSVEVKGSPNTIDIKKEVPEVLKVKKRDPEAFRKSFTKAGRIQVKPFIDANRENMGLENYEMAVFPDVYHEEQLAAIERGGIVRFITGLDEYAPEVQAIPDKEQREAIIYNIRSVVSHLEKILATNKIDVNDENFWDKVKLLKPTNVDFFSKISLRCGNEPVFLNPAEDAHDLIKYMAIQAGGFTMCAKSYEDALAMAVPPKFFLDREHSTVSTKTGSKRIRNKALSILERVAGKQHKKLLYITKVIDVNSSSYKVSTPVDVLYNALDEYINGKSIESSVTKASENFMKVADLDSDTLKLRALVKDGVFYRFIVTKPDGMLYHAATSSLLGRNVADVVEYMKNPTNEDVWIRLMNEVEPYWNQ